MMSMAPRILTQRSQRNLKELTLRDGSKRCFYLTTMNLAHVVKEDAPQSDEDLMLKETLSTIEVWNHFEFCCRYYILNSLDDNLYDIYLLYKTAKGLWESLGEKKI